MVCLFRQIRFKTSRRHRIHRRNTSFVSADTLMTTSGLSFNICFFKSPRGCILLPTRVRHFTPFLARSDATHDIMPPEIPSLIVLPWGIYSKPMTIYQIKRFAPHPYPATAFASGGRIVSCCCLNSF